MIAEAGLAALWLAAALAALQLALGAIGLRGQHEEFSRCRPPHRTGASAARDGGVRVVDPPVPSGGSLRFAGLPQTIIRPSPGFTIRRNLGQSRRLDADVG